MKRDTAACGREELGAARSEGRGLFAAVALSLVFVNLLMLTGPIFMLQVYDRVLGSRSQETLAALFALVVFLFLLMMGLLDLARGRVMTRLAARFQASLNRRVFTAALARSALVPAIRRPPRACATSKRSERFSPHLFSLRSSTHPGRPSSSPPSSSSTPGSAGRR